MHGDLRCRCPKDLGSPCICDKSNTCGKNSSEGSHHPKLGFVFFDKMKTNYGPDEQNGSDDGADNGDGGCY